MLEIKNLKVSIDDTPVLNGVNLSVKAGQVHAIMGPNGSGKSTLSKVLAGFPDYTIDSGSIEYERDGEIINLLDLETEERALNGVFLAFQYPVEIPGLKNFEFLKTAFNALSRHHGTPEMTDSEFLELVRPKMQSMQIPESFLERPVNAGFSGGEKKKNEILQMAILSPQLCILDETDSGLDIDALRTVADGVNQMRSPHRAIILITHYQRLLSYVQPDFVHVLSKGQIVRSGDKNLALELESKGYDWIAP